MYVHKLPGYNGYCSKMIQSCANFKILPLEYFLYKWYIHILSILTITSPVAVPSVVMTITVISDDDGLVRFNDNVTDPCFSATSIDDSFKQISIIRNNTL